MQIRHLSEPAVHVADRRGQLREMKASLKVALSMVLAVAMVMVAVPPVSEAQPAVAPFGFFEDTDHPLCPPMADYIQSVPKPYGEWDNSRNYDYSGAEYGCRTQRADTSSEPPPPSGDLAATVITQLLSDYNDRILLEWTQVPGAVKYHLFRNGDYRTTILDTGGNQRFHDPGVLNGGSYTYRIIAEAADGRESRTESPALRYTTPTTAAEVDCLDMEGSELILCELVLDRINDSLDAGRLSYDTNGVLFTLNDPTDFRYSSSTCSARGTVTNQTATARIGSGASLNVRGNSITEPFAIRLVVPFELTARIDAKTEFGVRIISGCLEGASDSYHAYAATSGTADMLLAFAFNPEIDVNSDGDLEFAIAPRAHVAFDLNDPTLDFGVSGVSVLAQFYSFLVSLTTALPQSLEAGISGDSLGDSLAGSGQDIGVPIGLGVLSSPVADVVSHIVTNWAAEQAVREAAYLGVDLERELNRQISTALTLDSSGRRTWTIDGDFAILLANGATLDDLLVQ